MTPLPAGLRRRVFPSATEGVTEQLGASFAAMLQPPTGRALRVWLSGDLGAGKTTFVRGLLRHLGVATVVRSPTYSLIERYALGALEVLHGDLYRLEGPESLAALGLDEFDRAGAIWLIEWPERGGGALPPPDLHLKFTVEVDDRHRIEASAQSQQGAQWLARVVKPPSGAALHEA